MLKEIIPVPFATLKKIVHVADTHIRLYKRYTEYQQVLERMINMLMETDLQDAVIVHCGDVVHSKTDMSPEMVNLTSWWLSNLANLAPTLVIAGNHDCNSANPNRLDALSPIIRMVNHPELHYLKHSGIYTCADVDFAVLSIIGDKADWPTPHQCLSPTKVALFHGPVYNATTDVGYTVTSRHVMVDTFAGFDMALLGDIHRHQVLQEQSPIIVYCGSTVQQNHAETLQGHGWCEWSVPDRSFKFVELPNDFGYYTLRIEDGIIPSLDDMPKNVRLRMFVGDMDQTDIKKLLTTIRVNHTVAEVTVNKLSGLYKSSKATIGTILDIHDVGYQNKLITTYLQDRAPDIESDTLTAVVDLNSELNAAITNDDPTRKLVWTPISLKFDNLFTYGTGNYINFQDLNGLVGLFAPNATGKSSIPDAVCFALYDKTPRTNRAINIMNTRETECSVEFVFEIGDDQYIIERRGKKNKKSEVKVDVDFYQIKNGTRICLNGEQRKDTNLIIRNYVGEFDDFILTALSSQGNNSLFIDRGQADRKDLLSQFMGLTIFDKLHALADERSKEVAINLKRFAQDDFTQVLVDVRDKIHQKKTEFQLLTTNSEDFEVQIQKLEQQIRELLLKKIAVPILNGSLDDLTQEVYRLEKLSLEIAEQETNLTNKIDTLRHQLHLAYEKLRTEYGTIEKDHSHYEDVKSRAKIIEDKLKILTVQIKMYEADMDRLVAHKFNPQCQFCVTNSFVQNAIKSMEKWSTDTDIRTTLTLELVQLQQQLEEMADVPEKYNKLVIGTKFVQQKELELSHLEVELSKLSTSSTITKTKYDTAIQNLTTFLNAQDAIQHNQALDIEIAELTAQIGSLRIQKNGIEKSLQHLYGELRILEGEQNQMLNRIKEAEELEKKYAVYKYYLTVVSRDGLPYKLISEVLPAVEMEVNNILSQMVEFSIALEMDGKNIGGKIVYDEERVWPLELASGMEKFISGLAIRVALMKISSLPKSNFLILDEGLGTLDQENLSSISALLNVLKTQFTWVLLISHVDAARDLVDSLLSIERSDGYSKIFEG